MNVDIHEAKAKLFDLVEQALAGEEVTLTKNGEALVRLEPVTADAKARSSHATRLSDEEAEEAMRAFFGDEKPS